MLAALGFLISACSQSGIIGSDLLQQDRLDIEFTDSVRFQAYIQKTDSILTFDPAGNFLGSFLCGQFADPVFGLTDAVISAQLRFTPNSPPAFQGAVLDSMVLILPYQPARLYGDTTETYQLDVFRLEEDLTDTATYYSNRIFAAAQLIGSASFLPRRYDSIEILLHGTTDSLVSLPPQVRIRLDDAFAQALMADTLTLKSDSAFVDVYKGIQIRGGSQNKGLLSFNLESGLAGLTAYYHVDTIPRQYTFRFTSLSPRVVSFVNDYAGAVVESFLQDSTLGDSLLFVQGMSGVGIVVEIPDTSLLKGKIVNRAELELFIATMPEDGGYAFAPVTQLIVSQIKEDGSLQAIRDVVVGIGRQDLANFFGGVPQEGMPQSYTLNLSAYFKELKNGKASNRIMITPLTRAERANRVVVYGPKHSLYPAKIKLSLTDY